MSTALRMFLSPGGETRWSLGRLEGDDRVGAAEGEAVADGGAHLALPRRVRRHVEGAVWIASGVVCGWRDNAVPDRHHAGDHFDRSRRTHAMRMHRLGGRYRQPVGMSTERLPDGTRLDLVVRLRAGAVGVDIVHVLGRKAG